MTVEDRVRKLEIAREIESVALANLVTDCVLKALERHVADHATRMAIRDDIVAQLEEHMLSS
jgi:hypothetical protein